jgi:hypothetical protein
MSLRLAILVAMTIVIGACITIVSTETFAATAPAGTTRLHHHKHHHHRGVHHSGQVQHPKPADKM